MKVAVYFIQFLKDDAASIGGGGIGTLISLLCPVLEGMGHEVTVYQCAGGDFDVMWGTVRVVGVAGYPQPGNPNEKVVQNLRDRARRHAGSSALMEIFPGDFFAAPNDNPLAICVQEGLAWDSPIEFLTSSRIHRTAWGEKIFRFRCQLRGLRRFERCRNRVASDLYFLNWYRSFRGIDHGGRVFYNPNPAPEAPWNPERERVGTDEPVRIIFARRFVPEKGTRLMAKVAGELLRLRPNVAIRLAGEGPDEELLRKTFAGEPRVVIAPYATEEALEVHRRHDVAVVPSLCGEATCLAVLEGMAAGCAVVATNLGGMITEIVDGYNGVLCMPDEKAVLAGLLRLVDDPELRLLVQKRGWEVSQTAFRLGLWQQRWREILDAVQRESP